MKQLEENLEENELHYWRVFEKEYGFRDARHHEAMQERAYHSYLHRSLLFDLGSGFVKWENKTKARGHYLPEESK